MTAPTTTKCALCGKSCDMTFAGNCRNCAVDQYDDDEEDCDPEGPAFECAGYYPEPAGEFYCPLWGSEDCDWECPYNG